MNLFEWLCWKFILNMTEDGGKSQVSVILFKNFS